MFDVNWDARSHAEIWSQLQGGGSGFSDAGGAWNSLASRLRQVAGSVEQATQGITATRSGAAADAARGAVGPMGGWADEARAFSDAVGAVTASRLNFLLTLGGRRGLVLGIHRLFETANAFA